MKKTLICEKLIFGSTCTPRIGGFIKIFDQLRRTSLFCPGLTRRWIPKSLKKTLIWEKLIFGRTCKPSIGGFIKIFDQLRRTSLFCPGFRRWISKSLKKTLICEKLIFGRTCKPRWLHQNFWSTSAYIHILPWSGETFNSKISEKKKINLWKILGLYLIKRKFLLAVFGNRKV